MTDIVREAEELLAGVTQGDWTAHNFAGVWSIVAQYTEHSCRFTAYPAICDAGGQPNEANADFLAAAPRLIRSLLQRLRETEEENQKLQKYQCFSESHVVEHLEEDIRALRAENAKLRAAVKGETFYHSDEAANEEMNRLRAERDELRKALDNAAVRDAANFLAEKYSRVRCDSDGVSHCIRCNTIYLAKTVLQALTRAGEE